MHLTLGMTLALAFLGDAHFYLKNAFNFKNANDSHWEIAFWVMHDDVGSRNLAFTFQMATV